MLFAASREHAPIEVVTASKLANKSLFWNNFTRKPFRCKILPGSPTYPPSQVLCNQDFAEQRKKNVVGISSRSDPLTARQSYSRPRPFPRSRKPEAESRPYNRGVKYQSNP